MLSVCEECEEGIGGLVAGRRSLVVRGQAVQGSAFEFQIDAYLHADMTIKQAALDRTRPSNVKPGLYHPEPDILTWLAAL